MERFNYIAHRIGELGRNRGEVEAESIAQASEQIRKLGLRVISIKPKAAKLGLHLPFLNRVSLRERLIFTRQLALMTKAGLPMVNALQALRRQSESRRFQLVIDQITKEVKGGEPLSKAMVKFSDVFPEIYVAVVRAGEQTGQLSEVLFNLADQQEKQGELIAKVRGAMLYPAVILIALIGVVFLVIFYVLPSLQGIFSDLGSQLPLTTRILFFVSELVRQYFLLLVALIVVVTVLLRAWFKRPSGRQVWDRLRLRIPIFGGLTTKVYMASFSRTMAMLTKASLPILQSLQIVKKTISNSVYEAAFTRIEKQVENGKPLSQSIDREPIFPPMVSQLISLGEEAGSLESVLLEISRFYDSEVDNLTKNLASLIEPIMLIIMGFGVGFVVASVLSPIYKLVGEF